MQRIKLVHITSSLKMGGAEAVLCELIKSLDTDKFEHHVIYFHDGPNRSVLEELGVPAYPVKGAFSLYDPLFFVRLYRTVKALQPDGIHTLLWSANVAGRIIGTLLKIPVASVWHNNVDQDGLFRNLLDRGTLNFATKIIAVSPGIVQSITDKNWCCASKILVIQNGVDSVGLHNNNRINPIERVDLGLADHHFVIGSVGRFVPVKNYSLMLKAFAILHAHNSNARFVLVGVGPLEQALKLQAQQLGIHDVVTFIIGQPAYRYYHIFNCFSLSSDKEGISIALLEAMSFGLPCVVTNVDATHPVIKYEVNGLLVPAGNEQKLATAYERIIEDRHLAQGMGNNACQTIAISFSNKSMVAGYEKAFTQAFF